MIPGWPYSFVAALEPGRTSRTLPLDAVRLGPAEDATEVTAAHKFAKGALGLTAAKVRTPPASRPVGPPGHGRVRPAPDRPPARR